MYRIDNFWFQLFLLSFSPTPPFRPGGDSHDVCPSRMTDVAICSCVVQLRHMHQCMANILAWQLENGRLWLTGISKSGQWREGAPPTSAGMLALVECSWHHWMKSGFGLITAHTSYRLEKCSNNLVRPVNRVTSVSLKNTSPWCNVRQLRKR